jgi:hypothetical protein
MSYESDQLIDSARRMFSQSENRTHALESRLLLLEGYIHTLQSFAHRAEPFIKAMELIDPPENKTP